MSRAVRCGPLSLLVASLLPVVGATAIHSTRLGLVCVGTLVVCTPLVVRHWRSTLRRLALGCLAACSILVSTWLYGGHDLGVAVGAGLRVVYLVLPAAVLTPFIAPARLGDHLAQRAHLPARVVVAATASLERLESLGRQWHQISWARRARGVGADGGPLTRMRVTASMTMALLVATMRMAGTMSLAMDARGFAGAHRRTWALPAPWRWSDTLVALAAAALAIGPWVLRLSGVAVPPGA